MKSKFISIYRFNMYRTSKQTIDIAVVSLSLEMSFQVHEIIVHKLIIVVIMKSLIHIYLKLVDSRVRTLGTWHIEFLNNNKSITISHSGHWMAFKVPGISISMGQTQTFLTHIWITLSKNNQVVQSQVEIILELPKTVMEDSLRL